MPEEKLREPSPEFMNALIDSGSPVRDCEFCGRTHFADKDPMIDWEEGEFEKLMIKHEKDPNKYVYHSNTDTVHWGTLAGKQYVDGCPCNRARAYEDFIWQSRHLIASYLEERTTAQLGQAQRDRGIAQEISKSLK
jgi:hypothetical protein